MQFEVDALAIRESHRLAIDTKGKKMRQLIRVVAASFLLAGCADPGGAGAELFMQSFTNGFAGGGIFPTQSYSSAGVGGNAAGLPNTPECQRYVNYAMHAGAPGTQGPLFQYYNACLASAPNSPASRQYQCAPGRYWRWVDGRKVC